MTIIIHDYNPAWAQEFAAIQTALAQVLGPLALRIDHIGSTSVPGLGAKDVIDVQITVQELTGEIRQRLLAAGYEHRGVHTHDHVPLGEDDDPSLWAKLVFIEPKGQRRANVHVRIAGNPNQRYALLFRDYLRAHPNSARSIELIKREIAKRHPEDEETYYDIKDPVYDLIWDAALDWARQTGWEQGIGSAPLAEAEQLGRRGRFQFAILFADNLRLYEANGYRYAENPCVWLKIHERQTLGIANEALPTALMVKPLGSEPWRPGVLDLLGYLF